MSKKFKWIGMMLLSAALCFATAKSGVMAAELSVNEPVIEKGFEDSSESVLNITTAAEFVEFLNSVNVGNDFEGRTVVLKNDIAFDGLTLNNCPVATTYSKFNGTLDGNDHKISGILQGTTDRSIAGIFYVIGENGVVKNLTISNYTYEGSYGLYGMYAGCIAAYNNGKILNCTVENASLNVSTTKIGSTTNVGAIVNSNNSTGLIDGCKVFETELYSDTNVGGIAGNNSGTISNCEFKGTISQGNRYYSHYLSTGNSVEMLPAGGICGYNYTTGVIANCIANVEFEKGANGYNARTMGGIVGISQGSLKNCVAFPAFTLPSIQYGRYGGVVGYLASTGTVSACYYSNECGRPKTGYMATGAIYMGGSDYSTSYMKTDAFLSTLNNACVATEDLIPWKFDANTGLPVHVPVYDIEKKASSYGVISCSHEYTYATKKVTFTIEPATYYKVKEVTVTADGKSVQVSKSKGVYSFEMPAADASIKATYEFSMPIADCVSSLSKTSYTYDGKAKKPAVTVKNGLDKLTEGKDYTIAYKSNTNAGTASVVITGKGKYTGTATLKYTIKKASQTLKVANTKYTLTPSSKAFSLGAKVTKGNGSITYTSSNSKIASVDKNGKVTIKSQGYVEILVVAKSTKNYNKAEKVVKLTIKPEAVSNVKTKVGGYYRLSVSWSTKKNVSGYIVEYATNSKFKNSTSIYVEGASTKNTVLSWLTKGKNYYVRVRAYKDDVVNGVSHRTIGTYSDPVKSSKIK